MSSLQGTPRQNMMAVLLILCTVLSVWGRLWFDDKALEYRGPTLIEASKQFILTTISKEYFLLNHTGQVRFAGDLSWLPDDINISDMQILDGNRVLLARRDKSRIDECDFTVYQCKPFTKSLAKKARGNFKFTYVKSQQLIYIANTTGHRVIVYDLVSETAEVVSSKNDLRYPNDIYYADGKLYIADTNHHRMAIFLAQGQEKLKLDKSFRVENKLTSNTWPVSFVKMPDNTYWILIANDLLAKRKLVVFSKSGKAIKKITLPDNSVPSYITLAGNRIILSSEESSAIYSIDPVTYKVEHFGDESVTEKLKQNQAEREKYTLYSLGFLVLLGVAILGIIFLVVQIIQNQKKQASNNKSTQEAPIKRPIYKGIVWIERDPKLMLLIKIINWLSLIMVIIIFTISGLLFEMGEFTQLSESGEFYHLIMVSILTFILILTIVWMSNFTLRTKVGTDGKFIYMSEFKSRYLKCLADEFIYSKKEIACPAFSFVYKNPYDKYFFNKDEFELHIEHLIKTRGRKVGHIELSIFQLKHMHPNMIFSMIIIIISMLMMAGIYLL